MSKVILHTDGGSRGNPGPSGIGFSICDADNNEVYYGSAYIGNKTNNQAEYEALIWGLRNVEALLHVDALEVIADSELVIKQLIGDYSVKDAKLKELHDYAMLLLENIGNYTLTHVKRSYNKRADELANLAMDSKKTAGNFLLALKPEVINLTKDSSASTQEESLKKTISNYNLCVTKPLSFTKAPNHHMCWQVELKLSSSTKNESGKVFDAIELSEVLEELLLPFNEKCTDNMPYFNTHHMSAENFAEYLYEAARNHPKLQLMHVKCVNIHMFEGAYLGYTEGE